jgi:hypothetical protein
MAMRGSSPGLKEVIYEAHEAQGLQIEARQLLKLCAFVMLGAGKEHNMARGKKHKGGKRHGKRK